MPSYLPPVGWLSRCEPERIGLADALVPGRFTNRLPIGSVKTVAARAGPAGERRARRGVLGRQRLAVDPALRRRAVLRHLDVALPQPVLADVIGSVRVRRARRAGHHSPLALNASDKPEIGRPGKGRRSRGAAWLQPALLADELRDLGDARAVVQVGEDEGPVAAHPTRVAFHHIERRADVRREVDLVDDQQIGPRDAGPALARDLVARGDVDDVDRQVGELGREGRGQVVAAALDQDQSRPGKRRLRSSTAARFIEASSRIAVCGQPPVSTPTMRSGGSAPSGSGTRHPRGCRCRW